MNQITALQSSQMALLRTRLFAGALFAGALFGELRETIVVTGGGGGMRHDFYIPLIKHRDSIKLPLNINENDDEETVIIMVLSELIRRNFL